MVAASCLLTNSVSHKILHSYNYEVVKEFYDGGSAANTFLTRNIDGNERIVKISQWEGIGGNGMPWLIAQYNKLRDYRDELPFDTATLFPKVCCFGTGDDYFFYSSEFFKNYQTLPTCYLSPESTVKQDLSTTSDHLVSVLCGKIYTLRQNEITNKNHFHDTHISRLNYRVGLLTQNNGELFHRHIESNPILLGNSIFGDITQLFKGVLKQETIFINGREFPNMPAFQRLIDGNQSPLSADLSPAYYPQYYHGDLLLRNVMMNGAGKLRFIDVRGQVAHNKTPSQITVDYEMAKIHHSFLVELVRNDHFTLDRRYKNGKNYFTFHFENSAITRQFIQAWQDFFAILEENESFQKGVNSKHNWRGHIYLSSALHFATDAINRICQDISGQHTIAFYLLSIIMLDDFFCHWRQGKRDHIVPETITSLCCCK